METSCKITMDQSMEENRNEQLCNVFEALVTRIGVLEDQMASTQEFVRSNARYDASKKVGVPFFGGSFCSRAVELTVSDQLDSKGRFKCAKPNDIIILSCKPGSILHYPQDIWPKLLALQEFYKRNDHTHTLYPNTNSLDEMVEPEPVIPEDILRKQRPGLIAVTHMYFGIAVANTDIGSAVATFDTLLGDLGIDPPESIDVYVIEERTINLARALLGESDPYGAWVELDISIRLDLRLNQDNPGAFYDRWRLDLAAGSDESDDTD